MGGFVCCWVLFVCGFFLFLYLNVWRLLFFNMLCWVFYLGFLFGGSVIFFSLFVFKGVNVTYHLFISLTQTRVNYQL